MPSAPNFRRWTGPLRPIQSRMSQTICEPARVGRHRHALDPAGGFLELLEPVPMRLAVHALAGPQGYRIDRYGQRFDRPLWPSLFDLSGLLRLKQVTGRGQNDIPRADEDHAGRGPGVGALRPPLQRLLPARCGAFCRAVYRQRPARHFRVSVVSKPERLRPCAVPYEDISFEHIFLIIDSTVNLCHLQVKKAIHFGIDMNDTINKTFFLAFKFLP